MEQDRPKVGLGVYILNAKKQILLLKRKGAHGSGTWCPPGGHLEFGESFFECVKREAKEETNLDLDEASTAIAGVTNDIFEEEGKHYVTISMVARTYRGELKIMEPNKCDEIGWFDLNNLPKPLFVPVQNYLKSNPQCLCGSGTRFKECHGTA